MKLSNLQSHAKVGYENRDIRRSRLPFMLRTNAPSGSNDIMSAQTSYALTKGPAYHLSAAFHATHTFGGRNRRHPMLKIADGMNSLPLKIRREELPWLPVDRDD